MCPGRHLANYEIIGTLRMLDLFDCELADRAADGSTSDGEDASGVIGLG